VCEFLISPVPWFRVLFVFWESQFVIRHGGNTPPYMHGCAGSLMLRASFQCGHITWSYNLGAICCLECYSFKQSGLVAYLEGTGVMLEAIIYSLWYQ
jgi:hypothetical protein